MPLRLQRNGHALSSVWVPSRRASSASLRQHLLAPEATPEVGHPHEKEPEEKGRATEAPFEVGHPHENEPSEEKERPPAEEQPFEVVCAARSASSSSWSVVSGPQAEDANVQSEKDGQNQKDADLEAGASVKKTRSFIEGKHVHCFQLCCARMSCSWCLKMTIFLGFVQSTFLVGPLSRPLWIPISTQYACEQNSDVGIPEAFAQHHDLASLADCEGFCNQLSICQAVDWYNSSGWCNLYTVPCVQPTANWDGASSYQKAVGCSLFNGTSGVLIGGRCQTGIQLPSRWSLMKQELPVMLSSPFSWLCTLSVTLLYVYIMRTCSPNCEQLMGGVHALYS